MSKELFNRIDGLLESNGEFHDLFGDEPRKSISRYQESMDLFGIVDFIHGTMERFGKVMDGYDKNPNSINLNELKRIAGMFDTQSHRLSEAAKRFSQLINKL